MRAHARAGGYRYPGAFVATRMIVTSQPDVACDVCGRRLLRGEQPDVFLADGRRRTVCELCAPRATHEGWLRETDQSDSVSLHPARPRRGRNLLGRLRQVGWTTTGFADAGAARSAPEPPLPAEEGSASREALASSPASLPEDPAPGSYDDPLEHLPVLAEEPLIAEESIHAGVAAESAAGGGEVNAQRALEVFNAGEHPRRVAGVARSLGDPSVTVRPLAKSEGTVVAIVIAWELSWYRYEVDLGDEAAGASVVAQGAELGDLAAEDRLANAAASADGALSLVR